MINELISMNGYGLYVWSAFIFTTISFVSLYYVTKLNLLREQSRFVSKFGPLDSEQTKVAITQKINKEIILNTSKI